MTTSFRYDVEVLHLLVSPAHAYFGRARDGAADVPTTDADRVDLVAGKGIVGDRFFGKAAHMDAAVTLMAVEALDAIADELGVEHFDPLLPRRNVILRGAQLAPLVGEEFALESGGDTVRLRGGRPAHPCVWMDRVMSPGVHSAMRGRGGIRCQVLSDGVLHRGPAVLVSPVPLEPGQAHVPALRRVTRLP
jgi:MOSC domain-containing protein YiiM